jgi:hypothetical protein
MHHTPKQLQLACCKQGAAAALAWRPNLAPGATPPCTIPPHQASDHQLLLTTCLTYCLPYYDTPGVGYMRAHPQHCLL